MMARELKRASAGDRLAALLGAAFRMAAVMLLWGLAQPAAAVTAPASAEPTAAAVVVDTVTVQVLFPVGDAEVDNAFAGNGARLAEFTRLLNEADASPSRRVGPVSVVGYASPDGPFDLNQRLARHRALNTANYLRSHCRVADTLVSASSGGIDWGGLEREVIASGMPGADTVLAIIRSCPERVAPDSPGLRDRKQRLIDLDGGATWKWMLDNLFPRLRSSAAVECYIEAVPAAQAVAQIGVQDADCDDDAVETGLADAYSYASDDDALRPALGEADPVSWPRYPVAAFRSNLLVPLLNVGLEVPLATHWSVAADYYYPWIWPAKSNKNCFELIFVSAEARYWFNPCSEPRLPGRNQLTGHSVGFYGAWGYYDIEHNYSGHQGHFWSAGFDYLFSLPIAKRRLRLQFELALGLIWSPKAKPYDVLEYGGHLIRRRGTHKNFTYLGPTKVSVSLVLPINRTVKTLPTPQP